MPDTPVTEDPKAAYATAPACWCRSCDTAHRAALVAAGATPAAIIALGSRFIVCPACGNKRCPRATNHTLACTNSNEPGQPGSAWAGAQPRSRAAEPEAAPAAAEAGGVLSGARLAHLLRCQQGAVEYTKGEPGPRRSEAKQYAEHVGDLLAHAAALRAALDAATNLNLMYEGRGRENWQARAEAAEAAAAARLAEATGAAAEAERRAVQQVLRDWRDVNISELPDLLRLSEDQMQERILAIRTYFDLKSVELTGRRLEPTGIYAGIAGPIAAPASPAAGSAGAGDGVGVGFAKEWSADDVWDDYCERCGTPERDNFEGSCSLCGEGIFKAMPKREAAVLEVKFDEWVAERNAEIDKRHE